MLGHRSRYPVDHKHKLQGAVEPGRIADVIQFLANQRQMTGVLEVNNDEKGTACMWFESGHLLAAEAHGLVDNQAVCEILKYASGSFVFKDVDKLPTQSIFRDTIGVLLDCQRMVDEETEAAAPTYGQTSAERLRKTSFLRRKKKDTTATPEESDQQPTVQTARQPRRRNLAYAILTAIILIEAWMIVGYMYGSGEQSGIVVAALNAQELQEREVFRRKIEEILARGDAFIEQGNVTSAVQCYSDAKTLAPDDRRIDSIIKNARMVLRDRERVAEQAREAERRMAEVEARRQRVDELIDIGAHEERDGDFGNAMTRYEEARNIDPDSRTIHNLIANVQARLEEQRADTARETAAEEVSAMQAQKAAVLTAAGNAKRRKGDFSGALSDYTAALVITPADASVRSRIAEVREEIEAEIRASRPKNRWSTVVSVGAMTVRTLSLDRGRAIDMLVTAKGGVLRAGKLDSQGKALVSYFENKHPRENGEGELVYDSDRYTISWRRLKNSRNQYRIVVSRAD